MINQKKYAVVYYFNYKKESSAGFVRYFDLFSDACKCAYNMAEIDSKYKKTNIVMKEYDNDQSYYDIILSYGSFKDGYSTVFYGVVESFSGVENSWNQMYEKRDDFPIR